MREVRVQRSSGGVTSASSFKLRDVLGDGTQAGRKRDNTLRETGQEGGNSG